jgi:uncharacterized membrane-anchored protein
MLLVTALWQSESPKTRKLFILIVFALMTPLGSFFSEHLHELEPFTTKITALVAGVMLHISTTILFESADNHKFNTPKTIAIVLGLGLAAIFH